MRRVAILLSLAVCASGCMTTKVQTHVERPALDVPPAPPRIIEPAPPPEVARPEPVPDLPPERPDPPPAKTPRPATPAGAAARETQKPEAKPEAPSNDTTVAQVPPAPAVPLLRTPATANTAAAERQIVETLERAQKGLDNVDYLRLTQPRQKFYNEAKEFITESEAHLKASNLEVAKELAEKAEKYATMLLQGR